MPSKSLRVFSDARLNQSGPLHESLKDEDWPRCLVVCPVILKSAQNLSTPDGVSPNTPNLDQVKADTAGYVLGCTGVEIHVTTGDNSEDCTLHCPAPWLAEEVLAAAPRRTLMKMGDN